MEKILVAVDGSKNSKRALHKAKKHAECTGGEITILTIVEPITQYTMVGYPTIPKDDLSENKYEAILKDSLKVFDDFTGQVDTKLRKGNPADEIIQEAEDEDYDLIIMGSRGLGTFSRTILGSVSNKVLNHTKKDVLIIK